MDIIKALRDAVDHKVSDIFLIPFLPLTVKINGQIVREEGPVLSTEDIDNAMVEIYKLAKDRSMENLLKSGDDDFSFSIGGLARFRASMLKQRGSLAAVIRVVTFTMPNYKELSIPESVIHMAESSKGFVLVTGPSGSGKSTTLACIIDHINQTKNAHVITLEDPIEYLHRHNKSVVTQREIGIDTESYSAALRAVLRQTPDVILLGEMRDYETIKTALTAAETGHLVISTLHTVGAASTIDRIIDIFPPNQQQQVRVQLSSVLKAVVSQQLIPSVNGTLVPAFEIMFLNNAIKNMIRESKIYQIDTVISSSAEEGMVSMDASLMKLYREGIISDTTAISYSSNGESMTKKLSREGK